MPRQTIKSLQAEIQNLIANCKSYRDRNTQVEYELKIAKEMNTELNRERNWLRQLCQEQSSSIAGYMRSR